MRLAAFPAVRLSPCRIVVFLHPQAVRPVFQLGPQMARLRGWRDLPSTRMAVRPVFKMVGAGRLRRHPTTSLHHRRKRVQPRRCSSAVRERALCLRVTAAAPRLAWLPQQPKQARLAGPHPRMVHAEPTSFSLFFLTRHAQIALEWLARPPPSPSMSLVSLPQPACPPHPLLPPSQNQCPVPWYVLQWARARTLTSLATPATLTSSTSPPIPSRRRQYPHKPSPSRWVAASPATPATPASPASSPASRAGWHGSRHRNNLPVLVQPQFTGSWVPPHLLQRFLHQLSPPDAESEHSRTTLKNK
eukprot:m.203257 g.203257  ORF g.203257 m.203257 type:complete len:302 (+) comp10112_c1_seq3:2544-3449(+)